MNNLQILYNRGLTYCNKISFLHITVKGKFLLPIKIYGDYKKHLINIIKKYNIDINKIGYSDAPSSCFNYKKILI